MLFGGLQYSFQEAYAHEKAPRNLNRSADPKLSYPDEYVQRLFESEGPETLVEAGHLATFQDALRSARPGRVRGRIDLKL